jgi:hypothetical protein
MDLGIVLIGAIVIAIFAVPFIVMGRNRKKVEKQFLQSLISLADKNNYQIFIHEFCTDYSIGIDTKENVILFYRKTKDRVIEETIKLADFKKCQIVKTKNNNQKSIDRLNLHFIPLASNQPETILEFYNIEDNLQIFGQYQSIERWSKIINNQLKLVLK